MLAFREWIKEGNCRKLTASSINPFDKVIDPEQFWPCLKAWLPSEEAQPWKNDLKIKLDEASGELKLVAFRMEVQTVDLEEELR